MTVTHERFPFDWHLANKLASNTRKRAVTRVHVGGIDVTPLAASPTALLNVQPLPATYAKLAAAVSFLATAGLDDNVLKVTVAGGVAVGDILQDAAAAGERVCVTDISAAPLYTVTRGYRGSTPATHLAGATWNLVGQTVALAAGASLEGCPQVLEAKGAMVGATHIATTVTIYGVDPLGNAISNAIVLNDATVVAGTKAFERAVSADVPCLTTAGDTVSIGVTKAIGLPFLAGDIIGMLIQDFDGAADAGAMSLHASDVSLSTYTPVGAPNGAKVVLLVFLVADFTD